MLIEFRKDDIVRHLGLLDLQRTMQRALRRSGLPIAYSNGFNPHMIMSFASALSSGIPGDAEVLDVSLKAEELTKSECLMAMNRVLPPSLRASRVRLVDDRFPKVSAALQQSQYRITLSGETARTIASVIPAFLAEEEIMALRKTKKSENMVNIRPMLHELTVLDEGAGEKIILRARTAFTEAATLKPDLLMNALAAYAGVPLCRCEIRRTALLTVENGEPVALMDMQR